MTTNYLPAGFDSDSEDDLYLGGFEYDESTTVKKSNNDPAPMDSCNNNHGASKPTGFGNNRFGQLHKATTVQVLKHGEITDDFRIAIMRNNMEVVRSLFEHEGVDVDMPLRSGWTSLMYACNYYNYEAVKLLIDKGADVNAHINLFTPLMAACSGNKKQSTKNGVDIISLLVSKGASVNESDRYHMTALMYAAREGHILLIQRLIELKASVNLQDNRGFSALTWAASKGHMKAVRVLVDAGADPGILTIDGSTPADQAEAHSQPKTAEFLNKLTEGAEDARKLTIESLPDTEEQVDETDNSTFDYGDLEIFLSGLDLSSYIPLFNKHQVNFENLLKITDEDLKEMGVEKLGVRKKILNALYEVHKKSWLTSSLPSVSYSKAISAADSLSMITNINQHAAYMTSTLCYIDAQLADNPDIIKMAPEGANLAALAHNTDQSIKNVRQLYIELGHLRQHLAQHEGDENYQLADLCTINNSKRRASRWFSGGRAVSLMCVLAGVGAWYMWQNPHVIKNFTTLQWPLA